MKKQTNKKQATKVWLRKLLNGEVTKEELLAITHPKEYRGSNQWEYIRKTLLKLGVWDDTFSKNTKFKIPGSLIQKNVNRYLKNLPEPSTYEEAEDFYESLAEVIEFEDSDKDEVIDNLINFCNEPLSPEEFCEICGMQGMQFGLTGLRVLHIMSPVRWAGSRFLHHACSNFKVLWKTVKFLPRCHHFVLVPYNHRIKNAFENVTLIRFPYPASVLVNRGFLDYKSLRDAFDFRKQDIDFIFSHQPELSYNALNILAKKRYGTSIHVYNFFHWVDSPKSRPSDGFPHGYFRQMEAVDKGECTFFHCDESRKYLEMNDDWLHLVLEKNKGKFRFMTLGPDPFSKSEPFPLPNKKILVFNHRWNTSTGIHKLIKYTEHLPRDEYLVWITDEDARKPKAGKPAPDWMVVRYLPTRGQYRYLLENCYTTLTFVQKYATWNLSCQDVISLNKSSLIYRHPVMDEVVGKDYPLFFKTEQEFVQQLEKIPKKLKWTLPDHDETFEKTLIKSMYLSISHSYRKEKLWEK